ncbi:hypothetical protein B0H14DRAFT_83373 [Mycena olivaceomarginata]|nr:hypothetical protein B0H14DRAFT_83373 [Mycena olivaceomarginata]
MNRHDQDASLLSKLIVLPGLILSTTITILLILESRHDSTLLYSYVNQQQNIFTLSTIASFSTRLRLRWSSLSLIELRLWQSISSNNVVWNLPFLQLGVLFSYILLHLLPSTLWAGAMSPMLSSKVIYGSIQLPAYPADPTQKFWNSSVASTDLRITRNEQGVFSYSPAPLLQGQIFIAASSTTSTNGTRIKPKNDLSRLSYAGRLWRRGQCWPRESRARGNGTRRTCSVIQLPGAWVQNRCPMREERQLCLGNQHVEGGARRCDRSAGYISCCGGSPKQHL